MSRRRADFILPDSYVSPYFKAQLHVGSHLFTLERLYSCREGSSVACPPAEGHHRPAASLPSAGILQPWRPVAILLSNGDVQPPRGRSRTARAPLAVRSRRRCQMVKVQDVNLGLPMTSPDPQAPQPVMHLRISGLHDVSSWGASFFTSLAKVVFRVRMVSW
jgi:hypothetical protein